MEKHNSKNKHQLLSSGPEFFEDLLLEIDSAQDYIIIKSFLWRNDEIGINLAERLQQAASRGVKILVLKDRIGAFYEYGQQNGQSYFHDQPKNEPLIDTHSLHTLYLQSRVLAKFYGNGISVQEPNPQQHELKENPNCTVVDGYKLYDHSKVIVVDGKSAYIGGITFGNEFYKDENRWIDYMLKIEDEEECERLLQVLRGGVDDQDKTKLQFISDSALRAEDSSMHRYALDFMDASEDELVVEMPFLGNPDYINKITDLVKRNVNVVIVLPAMAASHHFRNLHFLKRLWRQVDGSDDLNVALLNSMVHSKLLVRDGEEALVGSHNFHMDTSVLEETNVHVRESELAEQIRGRILQDFNEGERFTNQVMWGRIIAQSRAEYAMIKVQTLMSILRRGEIERVRGICSELVGEIITS